MSFAPPAARVLTALLVVIALGAVACRSSRAERLTTVRLGYFANVTHAQAVLAVSSGELEHALAPVALETRVFNAGTSLIEALFAGEIDVGYVGPGPALSAHRRSHGEGIRVVAGAAANGVVIVARKGSGIRSLRDLAGRRVATPQLGNTQDISARHYLASALGDVELRGVVPVANSEQAAMFERGEVDAAWVPEPWGQRLIVQVGAELVAEEKDLWPEKEFTQTLVVTTPEFIAKHRDALDKVLAEHAAWTRRLREEPAQHEEELNVALTALTGKRLPNGVLGPALARVTFSDMPLESTLRAYAAWSFDLGFERTRIEVAGLIDPSPQAALRP